MEGNKSKCPDTEHLLPAILHAHNSLSLLDIDPNPKSSKSSFDCELRLEFQSDDFMKFELISCYNHQENPTHWYFLQIFTLFLTSEAVVKVPPLVSLNSTVLRCWIFEQKHDTHSCLKASPAITVTRMPVDPWEVPPFKALGLDITVVSKYKISFAIKVTWPQSSKHTQESTIKQNGGRAHCWTSCC